MILDAWGRLDEAMALHKREEAICEELGNRRGLAYCYWNWGLVAQAMDDRSTAQEKLQLALEIFTALKMPQQQGAVQRALDEAR